MPTQFTSPEICRGKIERTVARMAMCQDRQEKSLLTIMRRRKLRKSNLFWSKMNTQLLIFLVGKKKSQTIKEYLSFFSFPGSTSLFCLRFLTPSSAGRWGGRTLQSAQRCFLIFLSIFPLWPLKWDAGNLCSDTRCTSCFWNTVHPAQGSSDYFLQRPTLQPSTSSTWACQPKAHKYCLFHVFLKGRS